MSYVWAVGPSIRAGGGTLRKWHEAGYRVAVLRQGEELDFPAYQVMTGKYLGWAASINRLIRDVMAFDAGAQWFAVANDDTLPDPTYTPDIIAGQCSMHFGGTFGVMQPVGDFKHWPASRVDTFAGSPWIGREFARRMYGGKGPLFEGYLHAFSDQELQEAAQKPGVFWQRPDLTHRHEHWFRGSEAKPEWWDRIAGADYHNSRPLFDARQKAGFPGHEPIA